MKKLLTKEQVNKKYKGKYIQIMTEFDYQKRITMYQVVRSYSSIHENTTLGEDVGTTLEYRR